MAVSSIAVPFAARLMPGFGRLSGAGGCADVATSGRVGSLGTMVDVLSGYNAGLGGKVKPLRA